jgi:hypothetical protein
VDLIAGGHDGRVASAYLSTDSLQGSRKVEDKIDFILKFKDVCRDTEYVQVVRHYVNLHVTSYLATVCTAPVTVRVWTCQGCGVQVQSQNTTADMCSVRRYV